MIQELENYLAQSQNQKEALEQKLDSQIN